MHDFQFYPTPHSLANKAWGLFKNREISRVLDPSAGDGDLLHACGKFDRYSSMYRQSGVVDAIEIDASHHANLLSKGIRVVGYDFMSFNNVAAYSHVIMNPPFANGCEHVLRAWNLLYDGEIVAIINAETLKNPYSAERELLARIVTAHGTVEYLEDTFLDTLTKRKTDVEIALVYLRKVAETSSLIGDIVSELKIDAYDNHYQQAHPEENAVMLPTAEVENAVISFKAAVAAMEQSVYARAKANYYAQWLGDTMAVRYGDATKSDENYSSAFIRNTISKEYDELKDRAWANILHTADVSRKLSSNASSRLQSEFEKIKNLEFSVTNIYGFLVGLSESAYDIQMDMLCEVFDLFSRYHEDNTLFYMGWKSNNKQRTCGMRLKMRRFIIPGYREDGWKYSFNHAGLRMLSDIDKAFAILDGKDVPDVSLQQLFDQRYSELRQGERLASSYFEVRYYPGIGTVHFFPTSKTLVDRLNRIVGQRRQWLPPKAEFENKDFWRQYDDADKLDPKIRQVFRTTRSSSYNDIGQILFGNDESQEIVSNEFAKAAQSVLKSEGYDIDGLITNNSDNFLLLESDMFELA